MRKTQATPRVRTLVAFGALGFAVQQIVSMGLGALGFVHSHYEIELGPHLRGWPAPPDRLDRAWINWVGPALFPMPDPGTGDNGDRGSSSGLQEDDRAQQLPFVVQERGMSYIVWRAPRGRVLGRPLGEQWAVVGPLEPAVLDVFRGFNARYGAPAVPVARVDLHAMADERAKFVGSGELAERAQTKAEHKREVTALEDTKAGRISEAEFSIVLGRHQLRKAVDAYLRAFGAIDLDPPRSLWASTQLAQAKPDPEAPGRVLLHTSAAWGWPMQSTNMSATYAWNGALGLESASKVFDHEESDSYDGLQEETWHAELGALVSAVPGLRQDGKPLWSRLDQDWIPLSGRSTSATGFTFLPGVPWRPLWIGAFVNTAIYALGLWFLWTGSVRRAFHAWKVSRARRAGRCATCGYPRAGNREGTSHGSLCPECGKRPY
jgi:hypothetical protein